MKQIANLRYVHDGMIDLIIADPSIKQKDIAIAFGYSQTAVSIIVNSDAFKHRLAERKGEISDPMLRATLEERLDALAARSIDKLLERIDGGKVFSTNELVSMVKVATGERLAKPGTLTQNNYVVALPPRAETPSKWLTDVKGEGIVDISHSNPGV